MHTPCMAPAGTHAGHRGLLELARAWQILMVQGCGITLLRLATCDGASGRCWLEQSAYGQSDFDIQQPSVTELSPVDLPSPFSARLSSACSLPRG
jgi:hypothetical protein